MKKIICRILPLCSILFISSCISQEKFLLQSNDSDIKLWYNKPATEWMTQALPIGNGSIGAMIFGGVYKEHIQFNEKSLWSGKKHDDSQVSLQEKMPLIEELLASGKVIEADEQLRKLEIPTKEHFGAYQPFGDLFLEFGHKGQVTNYHRELNLSQSMVSVNYQIEGVNYKREYFASYPDQVIVMRITSDQPAKISFQLKKTTPHEDGQVLVEDNTNLVLKGIMPENGIQYSSRIKIRTDGGISREHDGGISIEKANSVELILAAKTNYAMNWPSCKNDINPDNVVVDRIEEVSKKSYSKLQSNHLNDYQNLFNRVEFILGESSQKDSLPTDEALMAYTKMNINNIEYDGDLRLESLLFHYGRYLIISSSRKGALPANLQGLWNNSKNPAWSSDYHTDINLEMNYWLTGNTNLTECFSPFTDYVDFLKLSGKETAKNYFNARGFYVSIYTNPWGYSEPRWLWTGAAGWLCQNLYDNFLFHGDVEYLKDRAYPIMKDACLFYLDMLTTYKDGSLAVVPGVSPEINFRYDNENSYRHSAGATIDQQIVHDLFTNTIEAAQTLNKDDELMLLLSNKLKQLSSPIKVGENGAIQEWIEDWNAEDVGHRHLSHLYALYPGRMINPALTPKWGEAASKSLNLRGGNHTSWGSVWRIASWARLGQGDKAHSFFKSVLRHTTDTTMVYHNGGGAYENLFTCHSPFQIDGNLGFSSVVTEMLLQSHVGNLKNGYQIELLPALPKAWPKGMIKGVVARGGFEVDIEWNNGKLTKVIIYSKQGNHTKIGYDGKIIKLQLSKNESIILDSELNLKI
jgi:alpha-L-fucosidase 2